MFVNVSHLINTYLHNLNIFHMYISISIKLQYTMLCYLMKGYTAGDKNKWTDGRTINEV